MHSPAIPVHPTLRSQSSVPCSWSRLRCARLVWSQRGYAKLCSTSPWQACVTSISGYQAWLWLHSEGLPAICVRVGQLRLALCPAPGRWLVRTSPGGETQHCTCALCCQPPPCWMRVRIPMGHGYCCYNSAAYFAMREMLLKTSSGTLKCWRCACHKWMTPLCQCSYVASGCDASTFAFRSA